MSLLVPVETASDIFPKYRGTPIERLLRYHNLGEPLPHSTGRAEVLVGMCMDHRKDRLYPRLMVAPLLYAVENDRLVEKYLGTGEEFAGQLEGLSQFVGRRILPPSPNTFPPLQTRKIPM